jgi:hypothetical protein
VAPQDVQREQAEEALPYLSESLMSTIQGMMLSDPQARLTLGQVAGLEVIKRLRCEEKGKAALVEEGDEDEWARRYMAI